MTSLALPLRLARRARVIRIAARPHAVALGAILALAAYLDLWRLHRNGWANTYYSAAVHSMLESWRNFFFVSFDSGGLVSIDKPPLAFWLQAASAKVFGFSTLSLLAPEALAGVAAVGVLYLLVARHFGRAAGLVASLALAVSPVSVAVNRDNNPDALFVLLLVAAAWAGARAIESGRLRWLAASAALVGLAFETKMLVAAVVVPALAAGYLFFAPRRWRTRILQLLAAAGVLTVVSSAWIVAVALTPAADRPYVGSTSDNSALGLALGYNGLGRVDGQSGGTSSGGGLGGAFSGAPGLFRLINEQLGDQGGWLLPLAVVGGASALVYVLRRRRGALGPYVVVAGWFVTAAVLFSVAGGIVHTYYLSALAPATCALVGIGAVSLARDARRAGAWAAVPLLAVFFSTWLELALLRRTGYDAWLQAVVLATGIVAAAVFVVLAVFPDWPRRRRALVGAAAVVVAVGGLLVAPAAWSQTTQLSAVEGTFPGAGPDFVTGLERSGGFGAPPGGGGGGAFGGGADDIAAALRYVERHGATSRFPLIVTSQTEAAQDVIDGEPVAAMGGFSGRETVLTNAFLARLVRSGEARYFLLGESGDFGGGAQQNAGIRTIESACRAVSLSGSSSGGGTLYDCAGRSAAIAAGP